jgi:hypothetical protein
MRRSPPTLLVEALGNVAARPALSLALIIMWAGSLMATYVTESAGVAEALVFERELVDAGYRTLYVEPNDNLRTPLAAADCTALGSIDGVRSVMWVQPARSGNVLAPHGPPVSVRFVGGDVVAFLAAGDPDGMRSWRGAQVFIDAGSSIVEHGRRRSLDVHVAGRSSFVEIHSVRLTALGAGMAGNIAVITHEAGDVESCAMLVDDEHRDAVQASVAAAMPVGRGYVARWALPSADRFESPAVRFARRDSRLTWIAGVAAISVTWLMYLRIRRADHAFYALCGLRARQSTYLVLLELSLLGAVAGATAAGAIAMFGHEVAAAADAVALRASVRCACVAWTLNAGFAAQRAIGARHVVVRQLKDR